MAGPGGAQTHNSFFVLSASAERTIPIVILLGLKGCVLLNVADLELCLRLPVVEVSRFAIIDKVPIVLLQVCMTSCFVAKCC